MSEPEESNKGGVSRHGWKLTKHLSFVIVGAAEPTSLARRAHQWVQIHQLVQGTAEKFA